MIDADILDAIDIIAPQYELPLDLVKAICQVESSWDRWAFRYEPGYKYLVGDKLRMTNTERFGQMCSWGLMQVMGGVAREYGYAGPFPALCQPRIGINFGCRHLHKFFVQYLTWPDAIAAYNAGSPLTLGSGGYINQAYVDKVHAARKSFEQDPEV